MNRKEAMKRNFGRYATEYDAYATVQQTVGAELLKRLDMPEDAVKRMIDIGCGTGIYTAMLRQRFSRADILAVDICGTMIHVAREKLSDANITFVVDDAETMPLDGRFDLITSNACFQWFDDSQAALGRYKGHLTDHGVVAFSVFGPETFRQLRQALGELFGQDMTIAATTFLDYDRLHIMLKRHFGQVSIDRQEIRQSYESLRELLASIKYTGTRGGGLGNRILNRRKLDELEAIYTRQGHSMTATYEVFYCFARQRIDA